MASPTPDPNKLPRWNGSGAVSSPFAQTTWSKGYGVNAPRLHGAQRDNLYGLANGTLSNGSVKWPIFVTALDIDFSVQGSVGQSRLNRDFYPHNFVQPAFQVSGQAIDEYDYGQMCDFVHMAQRNLVSNFSEGSLMLLQIAHRGIPGGRNSGLAVTVKNANGTVTKHNQTIHGPHSEIMAKGVVLSMPRQHQAGVPAPTWQFGFQVFQLISDPRTGGPFQESSPGLPANQKTWVDLLQGSATLSTSKALLAENKNVLKYADTNASNVINNSAGG